MAEYTPMLQQYLDIKKQYPDCILFFRLGDFYEMFFDDGEEAAKILEIALTSRDGGQKRRVPMCGVPYHAAESYIAKLITAGRKVAICEQVEDPSTAKGIVKREVVRVVTPGSLLETSMLQAGQANYLACLCKAGFSWGLSLIDLSTGEVLLGEFRGQGLPSTLIDEYLRLAPAELLVPEALADEDELKSLVRLAGTASCTALPVEDYLPENAEAGFTAQFGSCAADFADVPQAMRASGIAINYLVTTQQHSLPHLRLPERLSRGDIMFLDIATRRNLELLRGLRSEDKDGSLLAVLDHTVTALGLRSFKRWLTEPLQHQGTIEARLSAVESLVNESFSRDKLRTLLKETYDLERLAGRVATGMAHARDLLALANTLAKLPDIQATLTPLAPDLLQETASQFQLLPEITEELSRALKEDAPISLRDGGIFAAGYDEQIDTLRDANQNGKQWLAALEAREREKTGIKSLKVGFNKVFGYYLEVTKSNLNQVPAHYVRKQTLVNAERYITDELKSQEDAILGAEERLKALEYDLFIRLRDRLAAYVPALQVNARLLATLDCLQSLAEAAVRNRYTKPRLNDSGRITIKGGRHPVVEQVVGRGNFVPNDLHLAPGELVVITGPNMGGKSTYMRQVAVITLMAQMGSFVPAEIADIGLVDRIFTRVGAADDLFAGQSTFMVEMVESRTALNEATPRSLILFDELGRGTSTYDGMALAEAIVEHIHNQVQAKTLFSTHYHELTALADKLERVRNLSCQVAEQKGELIFLRRVAEGRADRSYGINVAKMAGLPANVISRARLILRRLEQNSPNKEAALQLSLTDFLEEAAATAEVPTTPQASQEVLAELQELEINSLSPLAALNLLAAWQEKLKGGGGKA